MSFAAGCDWQCYLDRYQDVQNAFGANNVAAAESHYQNHGQSEGRDCTGSGLHLLIAAALLYPTSYTLHTPYTVHPIPYTLYLIPYTPYPIPSTYPVPCTLYALWLCLDGRPPTVPSIMICAAGPVSQNQSCGGLLATTQNMRE